MTGDAMWRALSAVSVPALRSKPMMLQCKFEDWLFCKKHDLDSS